MVASPAAAQRRARPRQAWRQPQGLPQNTVYDILQSRDGYVRGPCDGVASTSHELSRERG